MRCQFCGRVSSNPNYCEWCGRAYQFVNNYSNIGIPSAYKPISPWGYIGYNILFSIPIIGWLFLLIYAISHQNINVQNYARSFFCMLFLGILLSFLGIIGYLVIIRCIS